MTARRFIFALVLVTPPLAAQPVITGARCQVADRQLSVIWNTDTTGTSTQSGMAFGIAADSLPETIATRSVGDTSARRMRSTLGCNPNAKCYFAPRSSNAGGSVWSDDFTCTAPCTNCDSADSGGFFADDSGCNCDDVGEFPYATIPALAGGEPRLAEAPTHSALSACPAITGSTWPVDGDFTTQLAAAAAAATSGGTVEELVIPAGVAIRPEDYSLTRFTVPAITAPGAVVIRPDSDPKKLPPAGTPITPQYFPHAGRIEWNTDLADMDGNFGMALHANENSGRRGVCLENTVVTSPPIADLVTRSTTITAIDTAANEFTAADLGGLVNGMWVLADLAGSGVLGAYGQRVICNISGNTFQLAAGQDAVCSDSMLDLVGSNCSSNCGTLDQWVAKEVESWQDCGDGTQCATITGHKLMDMPSMTITGGTTSTVTVDGAPGTPANHQIGSSTAVKISGTGSGTCDGTWKVAVASNTLTLTPKPGGSAANCAGVTEGSVRRIYAISIANTSSAYLGDHKPRNWNYERVDADTVRLLDSVAQGGATGGVLWWESQRLPNIVRAGTSTTQSSPNFNGELTFDRGAFIYPMWMRGSRALSFPRTTQIAVVNSWFSGGFWRRANPVSGAIESGQRFLGDESSVSIDVGMAVDVRIEGNICHDCQMWIFADTPSGWSTATVLDPATGLTAHHTVARNVTWAFDWGIPSHPDYRGLRRNQTFGIEYKDLDTGLFLGNYMKGCFSVRSPSNACMEFSGIGGSLQRTWTKDLMFRSNTIDRGGAGLHWASSESDFRLRHMPTRITATNNLFDLDAVAYDGLGNLTRGRYINAATPAVDTVITRNTFLERRAPRPLLVEVAGDRSQGVTVTDNIAVLSEGAFTEEIGVRRDLTANWTPSSSEGEGDAAIAVFYRRGGSADPLVDYTGNVLIPGLQSSQSGSYAGKAASTAESDTVSANDLAGRAQIPAGNEIIGDDTPCAGGDCPDSLDERLNLVFEAGTWEPRVAYAAEGAEIQQLADEEGYCGPVAVTADDSSVTLTFRAWADATEIFADLAPCASGDCIANYLATWDDEADITRASDPSPSGQSHAVTFTSLAAESSYGWRLHCPKPQEGIVTTAGTP